ncbi:MAG: hypothetical protein GX996_01230, partial [Firmicutes bacterium]|nr:hypothetical protein [Bacillota bacterium]
TLTGHRRIFVAPDALGSEQEREAELLTLGRMLGADLQQLLDLQELPAEAPQIDFGRLSK